jgi:Family of unknown function (DUF6527)
MRVRGNAGAMASAMACTMDKPKPRPPSVGNWALPCQSHYWLRKGKVHWTRRYSAPEIADNRERDRRQLEDHLGEAALGPLARTRRRLALGVGESPACRSSRPADTALHLPLPSARRRWRLELTALAESQRTLPTPRISADRCRLRIRT